jgi:hypothetical protein
MWFAPGPTRYGGADDVGRGPGPSQFDPVPVVRKRRAPGYVDADGVALDRHAIDEGPCHRVARDEVAFARTGPADDEFRSAPP